MNKNDRRKALKALAVGMPAAWAKPIVDSVVLPAHALTTGDFVILNWVLDSSNLEIDGPIVAGAVTIENRTSQPIGEFPGMAAALQARVIQGSTIRAGGGSITVGCSSSNGTADPGVCNLSRGVSASNSGGGSGTLVPGPATALLELKLGDGVLDTFSVPVTLVVV